MPYAQVNSLRSYYERHAAGAGLRPLVMIHGASQDTLSWRYNIEFFAAHYDVVVVDLPGHGKSELVDAGAHPASRLNAAHVIALAKVLELESPILMGHSMGGGVASCAAAMAPGLVGGLVLVDGAAYQSGAGKDYHDPRLLDLVRINPTDWFTVTFTTLIGSGTPAERGREIVAESRRCIPEVALADIGAFAGYRLADDLPSIKCPVVFVEGDEDWSVPPGPARQAAGRLGVPNEFLLFEGVGHFPQAEVPERFNREVLAAMRKLGL